MGMYTELVLGMELLPDETVIKKLKFMLDDSKEDVKIDNPLFTNNTRWEYMLVSDSYYFDGQTDSKLYYDNNLYEKYFLNVRCNFKNYDHEIKLFLEWLCPYIKTDGFLGYMRYEEWNAPSLIYKIKGEIYYQHVIGDIY